MRANGNFSGASVERLHSVNGLGINRVMSPSSAVYLESPLVDRGPFRVLLALVPPRPSPEESGHGNKRGNCFTRSFRLSSFHIYFLLQDDRRATWATCIRAVVAVTRMLALRCSKTKRSTGKTLPVRLSAVWLSARQQLMSALIAASVHLFLKKKTTRDFDRTDLLVTTMRIRDQGRNQGGATGQLLPRPEIFRNTGNCYSLDTTYSCNHFAHTEKSSWLRPCSRPSVRRDRCCCFFSSSNDVFTISTPSAILLKWFAPWNHFATRQAFVCCCWASCDMNGDLGKNKCLTQISLRFLSQLPSARSTSAYCTSRRSTLFTLLWSARG